MSAVFLLSAAILNFVKIFLEGIDHRIFPVSGWSVWHVLRPNLVKVSQFTVSTYAEKLLTKNVEYIEKSVVETSLWGWCTGSRCWTLRFSISLFFSQLIILMS